MDYPFVEPEQQPTLYREDEPVLIRQAQREPDRFRILFRHYLGPVYRYLYQRTGNTPAAEDLTSQTFLRARARLGSLGDKSNFGVWLFGIARRAAATGLRGLVERPPIPAHLPDEDDDLPLLAGLVEGLSEGERELVRLQCAAGLQPPDLAVMFRRAPAAVNGTLSSVYADLANGLSQHDLHPPENAQQWLEQRLTRLFALVEPDGEFAARLEASLSDPELVAVTGGSSSRLARLQAALHRLRRRAWTVAVLVLLLAAAPFVVLGPQPILSAAQAALVRLPFVNYVNLDGTRTLAGPVVVERSGVTLTVTRALAHAGGTLVMFESSGLPEARTSEPPSRIRLTLPDGTRLRPLRVEMRPGAARAEFPPMPLSVMSFTLNIDRLPLIPSNRSPEDWAVEVPLRKANAADPAERLPEVFTPDAPVDSQAGVRLEVVQVSESADEIAVRLRMEPEDANWKVSYSPSDLVLQDAEGRTYRPRTGPSGEVKMIVEENVPLFGPFGLAISSGEEEEGTRVMRYPPLALASELTTLSISGIMVDIPSEERLTFDPRGLPMPGQTWQIDIPLKIGNLDARAVQVEYQTATRLMRRSNTERTTHTYTFLVEVLEPPQGWIEEVHFSVNDNPRPYSANLSFSGEHLLLEAEVEMPDQPVTVRLRETSLYLESRWAVTWDTRTSPVMDGTSFLLNDIATTFNGLTVAATRLDAGAQSTVLHLGLPDLPAGMAAARVFSEGGNRGTLALTDDQGRMYPSLWYESWGGELNSADPLVLAFPPLPGDVQRVTLNVPGVQLFVEEGAELSFDLPSSGGVAVGEPPPGSSDEPVPTWPEGGWQGHLWPEGGWQVNTSLRVGGIAMPFYRVGIREAGQGRWWLELYGQIGENAPPFDTAILHVDQLVGPGGATWEVSDALFSRSNNNRIRIWMGLTESDTALQFPPGRYELHIDRVDYIAFGPWQIQIPLAERQ